MSDIALISALTFIESLEDPRTVHMHMLRGTIARPSLRDMLHLNGHGALERWDYIPHLQMALSYYATKDRQGEIANHALAGLRPAIDDSVSQEAPRKGLVRRPPL